MYRYTFTTWTENREEYGTIFEHNTAHRLIIEAIYPLLILRYQASHSKKIEDQISKTETTRTIPVRYDDSPLLCAVPAIHFFCGD